MDIIVDENAASKSKEKKRTEGYGKLRKCGFDPVELATSRMIPMNEDEFRKIEQRQLAETTIRWLDPRCGHQLQPLLKSFDEVDIDQKIQQNMQQMNYTRPLPVQKAVIPYIKHTRCDMIVQAGTGSGKTLAFLLPIVQMIHTQKLNQDQRPNSTSPYAVIVAPTHELVGQLAAAAERLCFNLPSVRVAYAHGQLDMRNSKEMLLKGCDVLVCTAGRLFHYFNSEEGGREALLKKDKIMFVVVDEADKLLEERWNSNRNRDGTSENLPESAKIVLDFVKDLTLIGVRFRQLMFSATYSKRSYVESLVLRENCIDIAVGSSDPTETVRQKFVEVTKAEEKLTILTQLVQSLAGEKQASEREYRHIGKTVIFTNSVRMSDRIATTLTDLGFAVRALNAERSGRQRHQAMSMLMGGELDILVTTDVAERGLNIPALEYVINYDLPRLSNWDTYIHRIGRCGRLGNAGVAISLFHPVENEELAPKIDYMLRSGGFGSNPVITKCLRYAPGGRMPSAWHEEQMEHSRYGQRSD